MAGRDDFKASVKSVLARRVAFRCSNPECRRATVGPQRVDAEDASSGVAAHITAAAVGGPRYNREMTAETRSSAENGIWLCQTCSRLIDVDEDGYQEALLLKWKAQSEAMALREFASGRIVVPRALLPLAEDENGNPLFQMAINGNLFDQESLLRQLGDAALADLEGFKRALNIPVNPAGLTLTIEGPQGRLALSAADVARSSQLVNGLCVVAAPGAGKTVTLLQIAEAVLINREDVSVFIPMAEWASSGLGLLEAVSARTAFANLSLGALKAAATAGRLVLVLDAWNELDGPARRRAAHQLAQLRRDLPLLRVIASTRRQALDVPGLDAIVSLHGLSTQQQQSLARDLAGAPGERRLEEARRTPGLRELVGIPLYLRALLAAPFGVEGATTKEAVLSRMVEHHERIAEHAQALQAELQGCHRNFLIGLATAANALERTALTDAEARLAIATTQQGLLAEGQLAAPIQPNSVLDSLVAHHVLVRIGGPERVVAFQHQQLQEFFASFEVEKVILSQLDADQDRLRRDILDKRPWEESILFACERLMPRVDGRTAVARVISIALIVDPMLAALIVSRVGDSVWDEIGEEFIRFGQRWHRAGTVDRAVRFMMISGRPEFSPQIWPLISDPDRETHLAALYSAPRFSPRVLGEDADRRLAALPDNVRNHVLTELAYRSGLDGLELAVRLARADPSAQVRLSVVEYLLLRGAERQALELFDGASDRDWQDLARRRPSSISDEAAQSRLARAQQQLIAQESGPAAKLREMLRARAHMPDIAHQIETVFAAIDWPVAEEQASHLINECADLAPTAVLAAVARHIRTHASIPNGADGLLERLPDFDDGPVADMAADPDFDERRGLAFASFVGTRSVRDLLRHQLALTRAHQDGSWNRRDSERLLRLKDRVRTSRRHAFVAAWLEESVGQANPVEIEVLAEALAQHGSRDSEKEQLHVEERIMTRLVSTVREMSLRLLESPGATRAQMADVAAAMGRLARLELLPQLLALLHEDLRRWREAKAARTRGDAGDHSEAAWDWTGWYASALAAIGGDEVVAALTHYLRDLDFGEAAAGALLKIDERLRGQSTNTRSIFAAKFGRVAEYRAARQRGGYPDSHLGIAVFESIQRLLDEERSPESKRHALKLGRIALCFPYRERQVLIIRLLAIELPVRAKREFAVSMIRAGERLDADFVLDGLRAYLADAERSPWMLQVGQTWELDEWLSLLAFSDRPQAVLDGLEMLPAVHRNWHLRRGLLDALQLAPGVDVEQVLAELARRWPELIRQRDWQSALLQRATPTAVLALLDSFNSENANDGGDREDLWWLTQSMAAVAAGDFNLRQELHRRFSVAEQGRVHRLIERVLLAARDADSLLAIVARYGRSGRPLDSVLERAVEESAQERHESPEWGHGVYEVTPAPVSGLRRGLIQMIGEGGASRAIAIECLQALDEWHDRHGTSSAEPRHPDVTSNVAWPQVPN